MDRGVRLRWATELADRVCSIVHSCSRKSSNKGSPSSGRSIMCCLEVSFLLAQIKQQTNKKTSELKFFFIAAFLLIPLQSLLDFWRFAFVWALTPIASAMTACARIVPCFLLYKTRLCNTVSFHYRLLLRWIGISFFLFAKKYKLKKYFKTN